MRLPTDSELDSIEVTSEDEALYLARLEAIGRALDRAGITPTLEWITVLLLICAQVMLISGLARADFERAASTLFGASEGEERTGLSEAPLFVLDDLPRRVARIFVALRRARIRLDRDAAWLLLHHVADRLYHAGLDRDSMVLFAHAAYDLAAAGLDEAANQRGRG